MKLFGIISILVFIQACDPYNFGYKKNPAYILNEAFKAILANDEDAFLDVSGREALCVYGNSKGVSYLKKNLKIDLEDIDINAKVITAKHNTTPVMVGSPAYWSYYHERYLIEVKEKRSKQIQLKVAVDCNFGFDGKKSDKFEKLKPKKYKKKECVVTKVIPVTFEPLPIEKRCAHLKVDLKPL